MFDLALAFPMLSDVVAPIVDRLSALDPDLPPVLVVGAVCRDALHLAAGQSSPLRRTEDRDIGLAVDGWDHFAALAEQLVRVKSASSRIRYQVAGAKVDLLPFGAPVERPDGVVTPGPRGEEMSVFGFQDVGASAHQVHLPGTVPFLVPTIPGYVVLKLKAWADRSIHHEYKDGADLASAMFWYQQDDELLSYRLWEDTTGLQILEEVGFAEDEAAVRLLAADARDLLQPARQNELSQIWARGIDDAVLAENLDNTLLPDWPRRRDDRLLAYVRAVRRELTRSQV